ncbi:carcinoembryonic antigen-related cell adhesion molecule 5-like [Fundulus heteroclitus]|uniref:carcinoembryonic antigen-related cell adhesion molecule 5-like n=1 Tax=Fundulus heteroclitus TaxID=8078 RepID=UPI00165AB6D2|nr:carcinoembryonic antigen-related cell adhesion molecule 5-like [Fundulus heteroclitus]
MNSSSEVTASDRARIKTTEGGSTLTIINVTRYDHGLYSCHVLNPVSDARSDPVNISISYGPENTKRNVSPSKEHYVEGSDITLACSAESRPSAEFTWSLNGDLLPDTGPELKLKNIHISQSGNYSCQAFNDKTRRDQTSQPSAVSVLERVSNVKVAPHETDLIESNSNVRLSCSSSGSSLSFFWTNSSSNVTASDRVQISVTDEGTKLTIVNVTRHDKGPYICNVFNPVSKDSSDPLNLSISYPYLRLLAQPTTCSSSAVSPPSAISTTTRLLLSDGPENIQLMVSPLKEIYPEGSDIYLSCSVESEPVPQYLWLLDGNRLSNTGPELSLTNIQVNQGGNYSCHIFNSKTMRYITSQPSVIIVHGSSSTPDRH